MIDEKKILLDVIEELEELEQSAIWKNTTFGNIKKLSTTRRGKVGEHFIAALAKQIGFECKFPQKGGKNAYNSDWDLEIENFTFEIKTATQSGRGGAFQFNRIFTTPNVKYDCLLCVGIAPDNIYFNMWTKGVVATGGAGTLTSMEAKTNNSFKLIKRAEKLIPIKRFEETLLNMLAHLENEN